MHAHPFMHACTPQVHACVHTHMHAHTHTHALSTLPRMHAHLHTHTLTALTCPILPPFPTQTAVPGRKLFISNLPFKVDWAELKRIFTAAGTGARRGAGSGFCEGMQGARSWGRVEAGQQFVYPCMQHACTPRHTAHACTPWHTSSSSSSSSSSSASSSTSSSASSSASSSSKHHPCKHPPTSPPLARAVSFAGVMKDKDTGNSKVRGRAGSWVQRGLLESSLPALTTASPPTHPTPNTCTIPTGHGRGGV